VEAYSFESDGKMTETKLISTLLEQIDLCSISESHLCLGFSGKKLES